MITKSAELRLQSDLEDSCREAFCTSLLLTGSVAFAESVVIEAIELWSPDDTAGRLTRFVIDRSLKITQPENITLASQVVSEELRPVLKLDSARRHCFVLRMLTNLSRQACAAILGITVIQVDLCTAAAVAQVAELCTQERRGSHNEGAS